jgi:hypothetical protein
METSLHKQLKTLYAGRDAETEVSVHGFRIDAIGKRGELIEIQHASLSALRSKSVKLLESSTSCRLRIVKPIVARKRIVTLSAPDGTVLRSRWSPKRGELLDLFEHLVHFAKVFPRKRLTLEIALIEAEEIRVDRPRGKRRRSKPYRQVDIRLVELIDTLSLKTNADILRLLPVSQLPQPFDTAQLAAALERPRWFAQKIGYCLRNTGAAELAGKRGNSQLYRIRGRQRSAA